MGSRVVYACLVEVVAFGDDGFMEMQKNRVDSQGAICEGLGTVHLELGIHLYSALGVEVQQSVCGDARCCHGPPLPEALQGALLLPRPPCQPRVRRLSHSPA